MSDSPTITTDGADGGEPDSPTLRRRRLRWLAIAAALLIHLSPAVLLLIWARSAPPQPPRAIPVTLVMEQPKPPPPPPAPPPPPPKPTPPEPPPSIAPTRSGPDQTTTAPPSGDAAKAQDDSAPGEEESEAPGQTPPPGTGERETALLDPGATFLRPAERSTAPAKAPPARKRAEPPHAAAIGAHVTNGDPYLNAVIEDIARHLSYPEVGRARGGRGVAVYYIEIDRSGQLKWLDLVTSTGERILDAAAEKSIRDAVPFPPPPPHFIGQTLRLDVPMIP